ncbi:hypothetical protein niasHT_013008 [Heterodera trifolii]|uniref:BTB domain-containing protein n=1 Tax=Heterodera trifolii TaxID=157864 RepID=A0ABD2L3M8_9BILA
MGVQRKSARIDGIHWNGTLDISESAEQKKVLSCLITATSSERRNRGTGRAGMTKAGMDLWKRFSLPPPLFGVLFVKENKTRSPKQINVDKNLLAHHSPFFRTLFFSESELNKISAVDHQHEISIEAPVTFEHLKLLIDLLHDKKGEQSLNDSNVEGILHLAHQFMIEHVLGMCAKFLISKNSKMIKLQKYRIADKYSLLALRVTRE